MEASYVQWTYEHVHVGLALARGHDQDRWSRSFTSTECHRNSRCSFQYTYKVSLETTCCLPGDAPMIVTWNAGILQVSDTAEVPQARTLLRHAVCWYAIRELHKPQSCAAQGSNLQQAQKV